MTVTAYYHSPALIAVLQQIRSDHENNTNKKHGVDENEDVIIIVPPRKKQKPALSPSVPVIVDLTSSS